jgi:uncharacterized protein
MAIESAARSSTTKMADGRPVSGARRPIAYRPPWWLPWSHAQTIAGRLLRRPAPPPFCRERIATPDGDVVLLDFVEDARLGAASPLVLLLHGLEGSARRGYALHTYRELAARDVRAVGLNFRSCGGELNPAPRFYHSGDTADIRFVLELLRARNPHAQLGAIGFSLGGNALLKYLGEEGEPAAALLAGVAAVSVPYDLDAGARLLDSTRMGRFYTRRFLKTLIGKAEAKARLLADRCDLARVRAATTFREFDDAATAPLHGFTSAEDYYTRSSCGPYIPRIRVPTLLLHAEDDPFIPARAFPREAVETNPRVDALISERGGHVGFIDGPPWRPTFWAERTAAEFLAARLGAAAGATGASPAGALCGQHEAGG